MPEPMIATMDGTALPAAGYLDHLGSDAAALRATATHPDRSVPSCPGWSIDDLLRHVAEVYLDKTLALRTGAQADPATKDALLAQSPDGASAFDRWLGELTGELRTRPVDSPTWTWWPPDQTAGFWLRRMAQETMVHRWDGQRALGAAAALDPGLAADGVDEILGWLAWPVESAPSATDGRTVHLRTGGHAWTVGLHAEGCEPAGASGSEPPADAWVEGAPEAMLLWLWGRADDGVTCGGDPAVVARLRERLTMLAD